ncbi:MAG: sigma 54-dependent Fis family transcriptional regulator [Deltaproteobacteria bacterium]|nr:sigma 54-dependent Fis family transcriptional regulator [Deltaproteobacteria bacterium]
MRARCSLASELEVPIGGCDSHESHQLRAKALTAMPLHGKPGLMQGQDVDGTLTTRVQSRVAEVRKGASYQLTVVHGPDVGATFAVDGHMERSRLYLGHGPLCDLRLNDPRVSRRHATLQAEPQGLRYTDLGSTNGSQVNGVTVLDALLQGGETLQIGSTVLKVQQVAAFEVQLPKELCFGKLHGASPEMRRLYPLFQKLADSDLPVVVEGETGTGKEVLAEAIHEAGARAQGPFVVFDCTAVPSSLIEASLFGHERGAFTGAVAARRGLFEEAHGGTLFIDEIGDLELSLQAKLLRAVDKASIRRIGGAKWIDVDVRIISATRRDLDAEVAAGRFRDDLLFRLGGARIELPPLRARQGDVGLLATLFWSEMGGAPDKLTPEFIAQLETSSWPGNVRELRHVLARSLALGDTISAAEPPPRSASPSVAPRPNQVRDFFEAVLSQGTSFAVGRQKVLDEFERRYVSWILERHGGHVGKAAAAAGIGRRYFQEIRSRHRNPTG